MACVAGVGMRGTGPRALTVVAVSLLLRDTVNERAVLPPTGMGSCFFLQNLGGVVILGGVSAYLEPWGDQLKS